MEEFDIVNNPSHYCEGRKYEPIDVIDDWNLDFNLGNVVKYISRAGRKGDFYEDLKKAQFYLNYEITKIERRRESIKATLKHLSKMVGENENLEKE